MDILYRYIHFLGLVLVSGTLLAETLMLRKRLSGLELRRLAMLDGAYGMSILVLLAGGFLQWFAGNKPSSFYSQNHVFWMKLALVAVMGLLSIRPTVWLVRNRRHPDAALIDVPAGVRTLVRLEMALLIVIPFLAVQMARGVGLR